MIQNQTWRVLTGGLGADTAPVAAATSVRLDVQKHCQSFGPRPVSSDTFLVAPSMTLGSVQTAGLIVGECTCGQTQSVSVTDCPRKCLAELQLSPKLES